jgi:hypothetical protein
MADSARGKSDGIDARMMREHCSTFRKTDIFESAERQNHVQLRHAATPIGSRSLQIQ